MVGRIGEVHDFDAGELGCGTGLPRVFAERIKFLGVGHVLRIVVSDSAAREDLPAPAGVLGHRVQAIEDAPDGSLVITVARVK